MGKVFLVDISRCSGCYNCQLACKDEHCGNEWLPYAKMQPLTGQFWAKVTEHVEGSIPKVKIHYTPEICGHCDNPLCMKACENNAVYKREDGLVLIDPEKCRGCKKCMAACPYGSIYFNEDLNIAQKCTGCAHLLDDGKAPRCVSVCPTGALMFGDKEELKEKLTDAVQHKPELSVNSKEDSGCGSNLYYKNLPGKFIAGTIFDEVEEEVIREAKCILKCGEEIRETITDDFGDFWFKNLPEGKYNLTIAPDGFKAQSFNDIELGKSVNIGDIPFEK